MPIENISRYEAAIARNIKQNAAKTRRKAWYADNADAERLYSFLNESGEFGLICKACNKPWGEHMIKVGEYEYDIPTDKCAAASHPIVSYAFYGTGGEILGKMRDALQNWGGLTPKQTELVRNSLARAEARVADRAAAREKKLTADRAGSQYVGTVGERIVLTLTVERVLSFDGDFGMTYINLCRDASGNVVVYKGSNRLVAHDEPLPAQVTVKATVKAHESRDGVAQTLISRPKQGLTR